MTDSTPKWDLRWPDPVAMGVAANRILMNAGERPDLNRRITVRARLEDRLDVDGITQGILTTPWAIERVYWVGSSRKVPVESAYPLQADEAGRVAKGQGVLLVLSQGKVPVLTAWEMETGHYFVETLLSPLTGYLTTDEALAAAKSGNKTARQSVSGHLQTPVSRRALFSLFRKDSKA